MTYVAFAFAFAFAFAYAYAYTCAYAHAHDYVYAYAYAYAHVMPDLIRHPCMTEHITGATDSAGLSGRCDRSPA